MIQRQKRNSSKINLTVSVVFHTVLILVVFVFAAREGILGKKLKELTVTMVPKEKKPEPPKEKPPEPKIEPPKPETPKMAATAPPKVETRVAPSPAADAPPAAAPAPASLPAFEFSDGARQVQTLSNPNDIYKALVEHTLLNRWRRLDNIADEAFVAEVELSVDASGKIINYRWLSGSGDNRWDDSVKGVLAATKTISRPPPKGFPQTFIVRFDVESLRTESALQASGQ